MLTIYIGRSDKNVVCLNLPTTPGETGEAYAKLEQYGATDEPVMIQSAKSSVPYLAGKIKGMNYDDVRVNKPLDFLARRIACLSQTEQDIFSAALQMEDVRDVKSIINLSYNLDNYELIRDISDMGNLSRSMVSRSTGVDLPKDIADMLDYEKVSSEYFLMYKGDFCPSGLVLKKDHAVLKKVYDGNYYVDPGYEKDALFMLHLSARGNGKAYRHFTLALPAMEERVELARRTLGVSSLNECEVQCSGHDYQLWGYLPVGCELERMNETARFLCEEVLDGNKKTLYKLMAVLEAECPRTLDEVLEIAGELDAYEMCPEGVLTAEEFAHFMFEQRDDYFLDGFTSKFVDMEQLGRALLKEENAVMTDHGIVMCGEWLCNSLSGELKSLRLVSSLEGNIYEPDGYGGFSDTPAELDGAALLQYEAEIQKKLSREDWSHEGEQGLAMYLNNQLLRRRVVSMFPTIQEYDKRLYGVLEIVSRGELYPQEIKAIKEDWQGQASDGWGEGFEQREIRTEEGLLFVSFYTSGMPFEILEEEDFLHVLRAAEDMQMGAIT